MRSTATVMDEGITALLNKLGVLETEIFISTLLKEPFDYTEWRKNISRTLILILQNSTGKR